MSVAFSATSLCAVGVIRRQLVVAFRLEDSRKQMARAMRGNGKRREQRAKKRGRNGRFRNVLPLCGRFREGKYRSISLLKARRAAKEGLARKSAPGLLRTFRSRALTQTDILFSRGTRAAPRRDHTAVNLISTQIAIENFRCDSAFYRAAARPRLSAALARTRDPTFASYRDYDCSGSGRLLRRPKVNRRYYCTEQREDAEVELSETR